MPITPAQNAVASADRPIPALSEDYDADGVPEMSFSEFMDKLSNVELSDVIDVINPLQHIPVVSTLYRMVSGDEIGTGARVAGGALYGGPIGVAAAGLVAAAEEISGGTIEEQVASLFGGDGKTTDTPRAPEIQVASLPPEKNPLPEPAAGPPARPVTMDSAERTASSVGPATANGRIDEAIRAQQQAQAALLLSTIQEKAPDPVSAEDRPAPDAPSRKQAPAVAANPPVQVAQAGSPATASPTPLWAQPQTASPAEIGQAMELALKKYQKILLWRGTRSENCRPDPDFRRAQPDGRFEIAAHPHAEFLKPVPPRTFGQKREMHRRFLIRRRDTHQPGDRQMHFIAGLADKIIGIGGWNAGLLRFLTRIHLNEQLRAWRAAIALLYQRPGKARPVQRFDHIEQRHRIAHLVALQRPDQMQAQFGVGRFKRGIFRLRFLNPVFAEHKLSCLKRRLHRFGGMKFRYRQKIDIASIATGIRRHFRDLIPHRAKPR